MLRGVLLVVGLLALAGMADAEMPDAGDYVAITQSIGILERQTYGTILDVDVTAGIITLDRDSVAQHSGFMNWTKTDMPSDIIVIGIPTIISMMRIAPPN